MALHPYHATTLKKFQQKVEEIMEENEPYIEISFPNQILGSYHLKLNHKGISDIEKKSPDFFLNTKYKVETWYDKRYTRTIRDRSKVQTITDFLIMTSTDNISTIKLSLLIRKHPRKKIEKLKNLTKYTKLLSFEELCDKSDLKIKEILKEPTDTDDKLYDLYYNSILNEINPIPIIRQILSSFIFKHLPEPNGDFFFIYDKDNIFTETKKQLEIEEGFSFSQRAQWIKGKNKSWSTER
jgi:hypothetical protein